MGSLLGVVRRAQEEVGAALLAVLNVTPDSFFDGGRHDDPGLAAARIDELLAQGADVIDVGPESTRPGARPIAAFDQLKRARPAIVHAVDQGAVVSIDTTCPEVAQVALDLGAKVINDVSCLTDSSLARLAVRYDADLIIMHSRGSMTKMKEFSTYDERAYTDVIADVCQEWQQARDRATDAGLGADRIWFDPGLGFHKSGEHSRSIMERLEEFHSLGASMVVGASRKSFIGTLDGSPADKRLGGTIAASLRAVDAGARMLRVHDVHEVRQALLAHRAYRRRTSSMNGVEPTRGDVRVIS